MSALRLASVNVNGIRAAVRNGMHDWLAGAGVDILTLQEVRATAADLAPTAEELNATYLPLVNR